MALFTLNIKGITGQKSLPIFLTRIILFYLIYSTVNYQAADGASGSGLSFYELYVNKGFVKRYNQNTDGTNPIIYLEVDSTLLHTHINYSIKVYNTTGKSK